MKHVTGEPLDRVIAQTTSLADRIALLPKVIAVTEAIAYAHSERVIHRDLKPANVIVGAFGETVVIDWGLAKELRATATDNDESATDPTAGPYRGLASTDHTGHGRVVGTPAYMPREQARGERVDGRADVYALGAILYHVLAGAPPYRKPGEQGVSWESVLARVISGPPESLDALAPGLPPDLLAIVARAMARDPADRYPSAAELASDLRRFQTGQLVGAHRYTAWQLVRRWMGRHRTPLIIAAIALAVIFAGGAISIVRIIEAEHVANDQRALAEVKQREAEDSRDNTEDLLHFMLTDLHVKLAAVGRLELLEDVAKKALAYYAIHPDAQSEQSAIVRSVAHYNLGDVFYAHGDIDGALAEYREGLRGDREALARSPGNLTLQRYTAYDHEQIAKTLNARGATEDALTEYGTAVTIVRQLLGAHPEDPDIQTAYAVVHDERGRALFDAQRFREALDDYRVALGTFEKQQPQPLDSLVLNHDYIGTCLAHLGDSAGALAEYRDELKLAMDQSAADPKNAEHASRLANAHASLGSALATVGQADEALAEMRTGIALFARLVETDPSNLLYVQFHREAKRTLGWLYSSRGELDHAKAEMSDCLAMSEGLVAREPKNADWQRALLTDLVALGDFDIQQGNVRRAGELFDRGLSIAEKVVAGDPNNPGKRRQLAGVLARVGDVLLARNDVKAARARYSEAVSTWEALARAEPNDLSKQRDVASGHEKLGDLLLQEHDASGAIAEYEIERGVLERAAELDPASTDRKDDLAEATGKLGDAKLAKGDRVGARDEYAKAKTIEATIVAIDPKNSDYAKQLDAFIAKLAALRN